MNTFLSEGDMSFKPLRYLKLIGLYKEVNEAYKADYGKDKPFYYTRRFWGAVVFLVSGAANALLDVKIDDATLNTIVNGIVTIITTAGMLYGAIMEAVGVAKRKKKKK